jgi:hypothetical protein
MAESQHDDLADALARMADGDVAPGDPKPQAPPTPPALRAVKPALARPATARPASAPVVKAPAPSSAAPSRAARPAAPIVREPASPPAAATAPAGALAIPPSARKARPAAPTTRSVTVAAPQNTPEVDGGQSTGLSSGTPGDAAVIDDDDAVIVPPPDPSVFEYSSKATADMRAKVARQKSIDFRRTLIPILLTCGVLLIIFGSLKFVSGPDSVLTDLSIGIPIGLFVMAIILLALAAVNMISVKKQMENS